MIILICLFLSSTLICFTWSVPAEPQPIMHFDIVS